LQGKPKTQFTKRQTRKKREGKVKRKKKRRKKEKRRGRGVPMWKQGAKLKFISSNLAIYKVCRKERKGGAGKGGGRGEGGKAKVHE